MGQRGPSARLGEVYAPQRLSGVASSVGSGADAVMDRPEQEDEQGLREVMCERGSVGVRCHDSPHDEAARPCLRTFHTASKEEFSEVHGSKQPLRRSGKHSTTAWWHPFSVQTLRLDSSNCTIMYQGVATRNDATTREILAHRTGTQPNFAFTEFYDVRTWARAQGRLTRQLGALPPRR